MVPFTAACGFDWRRVVLGPLVAWAVTAAADCQEACTHACGYEATEKCFESCSSHDDCPFCAVPMAAPTSRWLAPPPQGKSNVSICPKVGARAWIGQRALDHVIEATMPLLLDEFQCMKIPVVSGSSGGFKWQLSNFLIRTVDVAALSLSFVEGRGLLINMTGVTFHLWMDWMIDGEDWFNPIYGAGQLDVNVWPATGVTGILEFGVSDLGRPTLGPMRDVDVGLSMGFKIYGTMFKHVIETAWWLFEKPIQNLIKSVITQRLEDFFVGQLSTYLSLFNYRMPLQVSGSHESREAQVLGGMEIDLRLCSVKTGPNYVAFDVYGAVVDTDTNNTALNDTSPTDIPEEPPEGAEGTSMMALALGEWQANTILHILRRKNLLRKELTQDDLPEDAPVGFSTDLFRPFVPTWWLSWRRPLSVIISARSDPVVQEIQKGRLHLDLDTSFDFYVVGEDGNGSFAFSVAAHTNTEVSAMVVGEDDGPFKVKLDLLSLYLSHMSVSRSDVGFVLLGLLEPFLKFLMDRCIRPKVNAAVSDGIKIPNTVAGLEWRNPGFDLLQDLMLTHTDIALDAQAILGGKFEPSERALVRPDVAHAVPAATTRAGPGGLADLSVKVADISGPGPLLPAPAAASLPALGAAAAAGFAVGGLVFGLGLPRRAAGCLAGTPKGRCAHDLLPEVDFERVDETERMGARL